MSVDYLDTATGLRIKDEPHANGVRARAVYRGDERIWHGAPVGVGYFLKGYAAAQAEPVEDLAPVPLRDRTGNRLQLTRNGERRATIHPRSPGNPAAQRLKSCRRLEETVMQNHRGSQRRRQERRDNKRVERALLALDAQVARFLRPADVPAHAHRVHAEHRV